jgi:glucose-1-phosphate thymidylyltransferase
MSYYPLSTLMLAGIREVLIISTATDLPCFQSLFKDGSQLGLDISYSVQEKPRGLAEAFIVGEDFIADDETMLVLGDNVFHGANLEHVLTDAVVNNVGATMFAYPVNDPREYGVVEFDAAGNAISIEEKPEHPKSHFAVPGLYIFNKDVIEIAKSVKPSARGELEITSVLNEYLCRGELKVKAFGRGTVWLDTGEPDNLLEASEFVSMIQKRTGIMVSCVEEIAYRQGFIGKLKLREIAERMKKTQYGQYLLRLLDEI